MARVPVVGRLRHILAEIELVRSFVAGRSLDDHRRDRMLRRAVERSLEIISEASRRVSDEAKAGHPEIPWPEIAAFGNLLRHEYQRVDSYLVWKTATQSLDALRLAVKDLIARAEQERDKR